MLKVLANLKKSFWSVLVIIIFLVIQSQTDLALPEYTSKIVNVGIQAGGIEDAVPEVIGEEQMQYIQLFSSGEEAKQQIQESYAKVSSELEKEEVERAKQFLGEDYQEKEAYVLKKLDQEQRTELAQQLQIPVIGVAAIEKIQIPEGTSQEQMASMLEQSKSQAENLENTVKEQIAIASVKTMNQQLGVNTDNIQNRYILQTGLQMLGVSLITMISAVTVMLLSARVAAKLGKTLREKVFQKVIRFSNKELREFSTASLITRSTNY